MVKAQQQQKAQAGNEWSNILPKSTPIRKSADHCKLSVWPKEVGVGWLCYPGISTGTHDGNKLTHNSATHQGMLIHSHLSLLSHFGLILIKRVELMCASWSPLEKKWGGGEGAQARMFHWNFPKDPCVQGKSHHHHSYSYMMWLTVSMCMHGWGDCVFEDLMIFFVILWFFQHSVIPAVSSYCGQCC